MIIQAIDDLISLTLKEFINDLFATSWKGREHEAIGLYVFGHLIRYVNRNQFLNDPTQIGLNVAVPQIANQRQLTCAEKAKKLVCKDLVIWPNPKMTCWDEKGQPILTPATILEWKYNKTNVSEYDINWLKEFSLVYSDFVGYAICADPQKRFFKLSCTRIHNGVSKDNWLLI